MEFIRGLLDFSKQGLVLPLQVVLVVLDGYVFLVTEHGNTIWALMALILISSLFVLQVVNGRFLLLFPKNFFVNHESRYIDTWYLWGIVFAGFVLTIIGLFPIANHRTGWWNVDFAGWHSGLALGVAVVVFLVVPYAVHRCPNRLRDGVAKRLQKFPDVYQEKGECPFKKDHPSSDIVITKKVIDRDRVSTRIECQGCGDCKECRGDLSIGYVAGLLSPERRRQQAQE
jgi:hypothetical protein